MISSGCLDELSARRWPIEASVFAAPIITVMLTALVPPNLIAFAESQWVERRSTPRYPIKLQVFYKLLPKPSPAFGFGRTIDLSSKGVLFEAEDLLPCGKLIELALKWPFRLNNSCDLQLIMRGRIVRVDTGKIAMCSHAHEIRTARSSIFDKVPSRSAAGPGRSASAGRVG